MAINETLSTLDVLQPGRHCLEQLRLHGVLAKCQQVKGVSLSTIEVPHLLLLPSGCKRLPTCAQTRTGFTWIRLEDSRSLNAEARRSLQHLRVHDESWRLFVELLTSFDTPSGHNTVALS